MATYLGSIYMDGTNKQITCHRSWGQSRKWGIWNAYNRQLLYLKAGDSTASWTYDSATIRAAYGASANSLSVFCGLAEEPIQAAYAQYIEDNGGADSLFQVGIGWNSTTTISGRRGEVGTRRTTGTGENWVPVRSLGVNVVTGPGGQSESLRWRRQSARRRGRYGAIRAMAGVSVDAIRHPRDEAELRRVWPEGVQVATSALAMPLSRAIRRAHGGVRRLHGSTVPTADEPDLRWRPRRQRPRRR
jgi:hypothetical protein